MTVDIYVPGTDAHYDDVAAVDVETVDGRYGLLENHIDCAAPLTTSLLALRYADGETDYCGIDGGILVKVGASVRITTGRVVSGMHLDEIESVLREHHEKRAGAGEQQLQTLTRLEIQLARNTIDAAGGHESA